VSDKRLQKIGLILLHPLPFDGSIWSGFMDLLPGATYAPTLYQCGDQLTDWAKEALRCVSEERLIVVGSSIGGSCALEIANLAPDRVIGLGLIGSKASCTPNHEFRKSAVRVLLEQGFDTAWTRYWRPLFDDMTSDEIIKNAHKIASNIAVSDQVNGVNAFHTRVDRQAVAMSWAKPAVLISGSSDTHPGSAYLSDLSSKMANSRFCSIAGAGHYAILEKPVETKLVLDQFIEEVLATL
jgi:pimeloyl-ACP methyl ester carboxylesterase